MDPQTPPSFYNVGGWSMRSALHHVGIATSLCRELGQEKLRLGSSKEWWWHVSIITARSQSSHDEAHVEGASSALTEGDEAHMHTHKHTLCTHGSRVPSVVHVFPSCSMRVLPAHVSIHSSPWWSLARPLNLLSTNTTPCAADALPHPALNITMYCLVYPKNWHLRMIGTHATPCKQGSPPGYSKNHSRTCPAGRGHNARLVLC